MLRNIVVSPRKESTATAFARLEKENPNVSIENVYVISISTPFNKRHQELITLYDTDNILFLEFDDVTGENPKEAEVYLTMQNRHGLAIGRLVYYLVNDNKENGLIIHCDAGISRSAGVAEGIRQFYPEIKIANMRTPSSNHLCVNKTKWGLQWMDDYLNGRKGGVYFGI